MSTKFTEAEAVEKPTEDSKRGDPEAAFKTAPVKIDETYVTPTETHNPIELHASVADFDGQNFTLYETTQAVCNSQNVLAQMLGVPMRECAGDLAIPGVGVWGQVVAVAARADRGAGFAESGASGEAGGDAAT